MSRTIALLVIIVLVRAPGAAAQDADRPVNPTRLTFEHTGESVSGFAIYLSRDGAPEERVDIGRGTRDRDGRVVVDLTTLPDGTYRIEVAAYNSAGEGARVSPEPATFVVARGRAPTGALALPAPNGIATEGQPAESQRPGFWRRLWIILVGRDEPV